MHLGVLGYLVTFVNISSFEGQGMELQDVAVSANTVSALKQNLLDYPYFKIEDFATSNYCRKGNVGMYVSSQLRDYFLNKNLNPNEDGVMVTVIFAPRQDTSEPTKTSQSNNLYLVLRKKGLDEEAAKSVVKYATLTDADKPGIHVHRIRNT